MSKWQDDLMWALCCAISDAYDNTSDGRLEEDALRAALKYHSLVVSWEPEELADRIAQEEADHAVSPEAEEADRLAFERPLMGAVMTEYLHVDGVSYGPAETEELRGELIELRDEALKQTNFSVAVRLSHAIALIAALKERVWPVPDQTIEFPPAG